MPAASSAVGHVEVWVPWIMTPEERTERRYHLVSAVGRLREGRSAADARAELDAQYARLARDHPETSRDWRGMAVPLHDDLVQTPAAAVASMAAVVALAFGVSCLNAGALLAAWWSGAAAELLTRMALGASASQLVGQLVAESAVAASAGVVGAVLVARACLGCSGALAAARPAPSTSTPASTCAGRRRGGPVRRLHRLHRVAPALRAGLVRFAIGRGRALDGPPRKPCVNGRPGGGSAGDCRRRRRPPRQRPCAHAPDRMRNGAGNRQSTSSSPESRYADEPSQRAFFERLLAALRARPELASVAGNELRPAGAGPWQRAVHDRGTGRAFGCPERLASGGGPKGVPLHARRAGARTIVDLRDGPGAPDVCVISAALARRYWALRIRSANACTSPGSIVR